MYWYKNGRWHLATWKHGSLQAVRDDRDGMKSWKWQAFERGALINNGREPTMAAAKRAAEAAIMHIE